MSIFVPLDPSSSPRPPGPPPAGSPDLPTPPSTARSSSCGRSVFSTSSGGFTLLELVTVLMVVAVALSAVIPSTRRHADRAAARAAREAVVGMVALARAEAMAFGGASLRLDFEADSVWVEADGGSVRGVGLGREYGVALGPDDTGEAELRFDALGLGRASSRTLTVRRGDTAYVLTVSAYGRVKRW